MVEAVGNLAWADSLGADICYKDQDQVFLGGLSDHL